LTDYLCVRRANHCDSLHLASYKHLAIQAGSPNVVAKCCQNATLRLGLFGRSQYMLSVHKSHIYLQYIYKLLSCFPR